MVAYEVKKEFKDIKNNKLRWLATDINLNCYKLGVLSLMLHSLENQMLNDLYFCRIILFWNDTLLFPPFPSGVHILAVYGANSPKSVSFFLSVLWKIKC